MFRKIRIKRMQKRMLEESYIYKKELKIGKVNDFKDYINMVNTFIIDGIYDKDLTYGEKAAITRMRDNSNTKILFYFEK